MQMNHWIAVEDAARDAVEELVKIRDRGLLNLEADWPALDYLTHLLTNEDS